MHSTFNGKALAISKATMNNIIVLIYRNHDGNHAQGPIRHSFENPRISSQLLNFFPMYKYNEPKEICLRG